MRRNLSKRLEILFPISDANLRRRVIGMLETYFADNVQARALAADGAYERVAREGGKVRAQEKFYREAVAAVRAAAKAEPQFQPLERPDPGPSSPLLGRGAG